MKTGITDVDIYERCDAQVKQIFYTVVQNNINRVKKIFIKHDVQTDIKKIVQCSCNL